MKADLNLSVVIPTINETASLVETVNTLLLEGRGKILEILIVVCGRTTVETRAKCQELLQQHCGLVRLIEQRLPRLGGAFQSGFLEARGSHTLLMFADLESDPRVAIQMAYEARRWPKAVISASRWLKGGGFKDYGLIRLVMNWLFQQFCALFSTQRLSDYSYGFRIYPTSLLKRTQWRETDHAFVIESIIRPMRESVHVREVPAWWTPRREGTRCFRFKEYSRYIPAIIRAWVNREARRDREDLPAQSVAKAGETFQRSH